jgi:hypothetical protein
MKRSDDDIDTLLRDWDRVASTATPPAADARRSVRATSALPMSLVVFAAVAIAVVAITGRGGPGGDAGESRSVAGFRVHPSDPGGGMDAIVAGVVETDPAAGCVWLSDSDGARYPLVWPAGTGAHADPLEIELADGQVVRSGDRVEGGGGYVDAASATRGLGLEPFPPACVQAGEAAVFNSSSQITVTAGVGLVLAETLVDRFSPPQPIGLELVAVNADARSVAIVDFVTGTVHRYEPGQYVAPADVLDGASGGGGFIHVWANGSIYSYPGRLDSEPLVYQPDPLRQTPGIASTLEVLPAPDGEHTWLIQPGDDDTLIELVSLVEVRVSRLMSTAIEGSWQPVGSTVEGIVLVTDGPEPLTRLVGTNGAIQAEVQGAALSVGWNGAAIVHPDGSLTVTDALLGNPIRIDKPGEGEWVAVGGPVVPATSPPARTGTDRFLVALTTDDPSGSFFSGGDLIVVDATGAAAPIYELSAGSHLASWSRGEDWVVVVEDASVTLISVDDGSPTPLGVLVPDSHWVLTAG